MIIIIILSLNVSLCVVVCLHVLFTCFVCLFVCLQDVSKYINVTKEHFEKMRAIQELECNILEYKVNASQTYSFSFSLSALQNEFVPKSISTIILSY